MPRNVLNRAVVVPLDFDRDGDSDLFVGSRSIPNQYGIPPKNFLLENNGRGQFRDIIAEVAPDLQRIGMITDAQLVDLLGNRLEELVVVGEWMSPEIFSIEDGKFKKESTNLKRFSGWWYSLANDDVDADGDMDLILGNRGENFYFTGSSEAPAKLWLNDFDDNGAVEKIITQSLEGRDMPVAMKRALTEQIVSLKKQNLKHKEYAGKAISDLFPEEILARSLVLQGNYFKSAVAINKGRGNFEVEALPKEVQFSCVCDISCTDLNGDGRADLVLGGNDSGFMPQFSKLDASFGHVLMNRGNGTYERLENYQTQFFVRGDIRKILNLELAGQPHLLVIVNGEAPKLFKLNLKTSILK